MSPRTLFRSLATAEAVTWALLLLGMVLKYGTHTTELGVRVFGMAHGVVFIAYCLGVLAVGANNRWRATDLALGLVSAVVPFATLAFERRLTRAGRLAGDWYRAEPGSHQPGTTGQRLVARAVARPRLTAALAVVAVAALTGIALLIGPPASSGG